ncbi:hypothetical protein KEM54_006173 [Ascosphaera aggregata]|nr:hypothetical protein KEM54_006173 [Ascosphaera aggregata]
MVANSLQEQAAAALLDFLDDGSFPDKEEIVSSTFDAASCAASLKLIQGSKAKAEKELSLLSRDSISEVDAWIKQAKQLQEDIERSRTTARHIVSQHENGRRLQAAVRDASLKVELLQKEIALNEAVTREFQQVRYLREQASRLHDQISHEDVQVCLRALNDLKRQCGQSHLPPRSLVIKVLRETISGLEEKLLKTVTTTWDSLVKTSTSGRSLSIYGKVCPSACIAIPLTIVGDLETLEKFVSALNEFGALYRIEEPLERDVLLMLRQAFNFDGPSYSSFILGNDNVNLSQSQESVTIPGQLDNVLSVFRFIKDKLPRDVTTPLISASAALLTSTLIPEALSRAIPDAVLEMKSFQHVIEHSCSLSAELRDMGCPDYEKLPRWKDNIPRLWLEQRRALTLQQARNEIWKAVREEPEVVDLVETRRVRKDVNTNPSTEEEVNDWAVNWETDEGSEGQIPPNAAKENRVESHKVAHEPEDDPDDRSKDTDVLANNRGAGEGSEDDMWGWDDDNIESDIQIAPERGISSSVKPSAATSDNSEKQQSSLLALTERYSITHVPNKILDLIMRQIDDYQLLSNKEYTGLSISQCGPGLLTLPTLILAIYRAIASSIYTQTLASGNMYIHNDCTYLGGRLREIIRTHSLSRLESDLDEIERFGKLCYSSEMQSHRVILTDILEGAKGFSHCSSQPSMSDCQIAINSVCEHIRSTHAAWKPVLWKSALLQAIASLLSTVIERIIVNVEDLSDISANDSQAMVELFTQISQLEDIFMPEGATDADREGGLVTPRTAVFVPKWLKFQYLLNILDSSLADIRYLWVEGELSLEYSEDEIIDLLKALFAESEHRRKAISEIKRSTR